jgi:hypothetical protein
MAIATANAAVRIFSTRWKTSADAQRIDEQGSHILPAQVGNMTTLVPPKDQ